MVEMDHRQVEADCGRVSTTECLSMVADLSRSLPGRAVAAWFSSGINYPYQNRVGVGDMSSHVSPPISVACRHSGLSNANDIDSGQFIDRSACPPGRLHLFQAANQSN